jgi:hypothetical protein
MRTSNGPIGLPARPRMRAPPGFPRVFAAEFQDREAQPIQQGEIAVHPRAPERAVEQLVHHDGRQGHVGGRSDRSRVAAREAASFSTAITAFVSSKKGISGRSGPPQPFWRIARPLLAARRKSSSIPGERVEPPQSAATGSSTTASPCRRMRTPPRRTGTLRGGGRAARDRSGKASRSPRRGRRARPSGDGRGRRQRRPVHRRRRRAAGNTSTFASFRTRWPICASTSATSASPGSAGRAPA